MEPTIDLRARNGIATRWSRGNLET